MDTPAFGPAFARKVPSEEARLQDSIYDTVTVQRVPVCSSGVGVPPEPASQQ